MSAPSPSSPRRDLATSASAESSEQARYEALVLDTLKQLRAEFDLKSDLVSRQVEGDQDEEDLRPRRRNRHADRYLNLQIEQAVEAGPEFVRKLLKALLTICDFDVSDRLSDQIEQMLAIESRGALITDAATLPNFNARRGLGPTRIALWRGDITTLRVGAIVNAANDGMLGCFLPFHSCIDNVIHDRAGPRLRSACRRFMEEQNYQPEGTGLAKITPAYALPSQFVLHTVGPIVDERHPEPQPLLLASCYRSCLDLAKAKGVRSVAFCCISTGVFGYPQRPAAEVALTAVRDWLEAEANRQAMDTIVFNVYTEKDLDIYDSLIGGVYSDSA